MAVLDAGQIEQFRRDGFLVVESVLDEVSLQALDEVQRDWIVEAARRSASHGETADGRARFDVATNDNRPAILRRVNNPVEISETYYKTAFDGVIPDMVAALIGPDVKYHHSKINLKQPGSSVAVRFHQDFPYTPHSNDDIVTALVMLDDMTQDNGCLIVVPGSHREEIHSLWHDGRFTGAVADSVVEANRHRMVPVTGAAGTVCLMHTRMLHGSGRNESDEPRSLFIPVYSAADAVPLAPSPVPSVYQGRIVRGNESRTARMAALVVELPQAYTESSFFGVQDRQG